MQHAAGQDAGRATAGPLEDAQSSPQANKRRGPADLQTCEEDAVQQRGLLPSCSCCARRACCTCRACALARQRQRDACDGHRPSLSILPCPEARFRPQLCIAAVAFYRAAGLIACQQQGFGQWGRLHGGGGALQLGGHASDGMGKDC